MLSSMECYSSDCIEVRVHVELMRKHDRQRSAVFARCLRIELTSIHGNGAVVYASKNFMNNVGRRRLVVGGRKSGIGSRESDIGNCTECVADRPPRASIKERCCGSAYIVSRGVHLTVDCASCRVNGGSPISFTPPPSLFINLAQRTHLST